MNVTVLYGGPSAEREVSLVSGKSVIEGLKQAGHTVHPSDVSPTDLSFLQVKADVIFPVLHGNFGESGELQEILESNKLPFVGSGSKASRIGIDKSATKRVWEAAGLPTPPYQVITRADAASKKWHALGSKAAVKALDSGSSIDVHICKTQEDIDQSVAAILAKHEKVLVEKFVKGPELTVGLLEDKPLAPILIVPKKEFFDYEAKYQRNDTEHRFDTGLPEGVIVHVQSLVERANAAVGARDLARIDVLLDESDNLKPYLIEINTLPGFTPKSLLPEAAAHAGLPFPQLVDRLVKRAHARGAA
jgi:D-alanine-D-alanine ligase